MERDINGGHLNKASLFKAIIKMIVGAGPGQRERKREREKSNVADIEIINTANNYLMGYPQQFIVFTTSAHA